MLKLELSFDGLCFSARGNGPVVQHILEGEEESSSQNTLADFRDNSWKHESVYAAIVVRSDLPLYNPL